ncbi:MAG: tRNA pseudouridine(55) synthase TruB, partial [Cyclobacteriaceae bacterium]
MDFVEGEVICIDKPYEWSSFDVVKKIRGGLRIKKIGHAGTLDPLATGLLILCTGKKTKKINEIMEGNKVYTGTIELGKTTPSLDKETDISATKPIDHLTEELIHEATKHFNGYIKQVPPIFSAIKVGGQRLYKKARKGVDVKIEPRFVLIESFTITEINLPFVNFEVCCGKGTYIRSLARDFGEKLNTLGYLTALRRTKIASFSVDDALEPNEFINTQKA